MRISPLLASRSALVAILLTGCGGANVGALGSPAADGGGGDATTTTIGGGSDGGSGDGGGPQGFGADAGPSEDGGATGCTGAQKSCGGVCVADDPSHGCGGASCAPCSLPFTSDAVCKAGACAIGTCAPGRADCDGDPSNGCEVDITSDPSHCGSCTTACATSQVCNGGACAATCGDGLTDCSGSCVDLASDPSHCGACATACPSVPGGTPSCNDSACGSSCSAGYNLCGGSCAPNGPAACGASCAVCPTPANRTATCTPSGTCGVDCASGYVPCGASCCSGTTTNPTQPFTDGSRLKVIWLTTSDGLEQFQGWEDTALSVQCFHVTAADGQMRCLPYTAASIVAQEFVDSACTQPIAYVPASPASCAATAPYAESQDSNPCAQWTHVYPVGASTSAQHYSKASGTCAPTAGNATGTYYAVGAEMAASSFVASTTSYGTTVDGVALRTQTGSDGSSGAMELDDVASKTACVSYTLGDGLPHCIPSSNAWNDPDYFADDACQDPLFYLYPTLCATPASVGILYQNVTSPSTCNQEVNVYALGSALTTAPPAWTNSSGTCVASTLSAGPTAYFVGGSALPPSTYATLTTSAPLGSSRIQEVDQVVGSSTSTVRQAASLYDSARGESCSFTTAGDGVMRCLPTGMQATLYFQDAACTKPYGAVPSDQCGPAPKYISEVDNTTCPPRTHIVTPGPQFTGTSLYVLQSGTCTAGGANGWDVYSLGTEVAATSFVEGTVTVP